MYSEIQSLQLARSTEEPVLDVVVDTAVAGGVVALGFVHCEVVGRCH